MDTEKQMTVNEFADIIKKNIDDFAKRWISSNSKGGEKYYDTTYEKAFPLEMPEGEWFDNFLTDLTMGQPN